jgi:hypothetical protein
MKSSKNSCWTSDSKLVDAVAAATATAGSVSGCSEHSEQEEEGKEEAEEAMVKAETGESETETAKLETDRDTRRRPTEFDLAQFAHKTGHKPHKTRHEDRMRNGSK